MPHYDVVPGVSNPVLSLNCDLVLDEDMDMFMLVL